MTGSCSNREQVLELLLTDQIESLEKSSKEIEVKLKRARHLQKATAKRRQLSLEDLSDISRLMENQNHASFAVENVWECHSNLPSLSDGPTGCHLLFKDPRGLFVVCPTFLIAINLLVYHYRKQVE